MTLPIFLASVGLGLFFCYPACAQSHNWVTPGDFAASGIAIAPRMEARHLGPGLSRIYQVDPSTGMRRPLAYKTWSPATGHITGVHPLHGAMPLLTAPLGYPLDSHPAWRASRSPFVGFVPGNVNVTISRGSSSINHMQNRSASRSCDQPLMRGPWFSNHLQLGPFLPYAIDENFALEW